MPSFYYVTWNAQGGLITDTGKLQVLKDIVANANGVPCFFAIQEAGSNPTLHQKLNSIAYKQVWQAPTGAKNERCTLGILVPNNIRCNLSYIECSTVRKIVCCDLEMPAIRLACIHAIAQSTMALSEITKALNALKSYNRPFILAGDMNCAPFANVGNGIKLLHSGQPTHQNGNELDYFFASTSIKAISINTYSSNYSDHDPVILEVHI